MFTFEWNENKAKANIRKHNISFEEAESVFDDEFLVTFPDEFHSMDEERFISIGFSNANRVLLVVHMEQIANADEIVIRIISCRKATKLEREVYDQQR